MTQFSYIARDDRGRIDRGTMDMPSAEAVREALRKKNLTVDQIVETAVKEHPVIGFTPAMPWTMIEDKKEERKTEKAIKKEEKAYIPLTDTLRLFAGWLVAWYGAVYALGALQMEQKLPFDIPFLEALFVSPLVLRFTFATFLFLLLTHVQRGTNGGIGKGIGLTVLGVLVFVLFHLNA